MSDRDPILLRVIKNKFQKDAGWNSVIVNSYEQAMDAFGKDHYDLVLTEILGGDISGKNGFDLIKEIRDVNREIPIVVFSTLSQPEDRKRAEELGASHYFPKTDFSLVDVIGRIKNILEQKSSRSA